MVQLTEQFTKWSYEVRRADEAPSALRRALKLALTPPTGPVFLSLPMDLMIRGGGGLGGRPRPTIARRCRPEARRDRRGGHAPERRAGARSSSRATAWRARAPCPSSSRSPSARCAACTASRSSGARAFRAIIRCGAAGSSRRPRRAQGARRRRRACSSSAPRSSRGSSTRRARRSRRGLPVVQIDDDAWEIGQEPSPSRSGSWPIRAPRSRALTSALAHASDRRRARGGRRLGRARCGQARGARRVARASAAAEAERDRVPISQRYLMRTLAAVAPRDVAVVDESASSLPHVLRYFSMATPGSFFGSKTGTLGWGDGRGARRAARARPAARSSPPSATAR